MRMISVPIFAMTILIVVFIVLLAMVALLAALKRKDAPIPASQAYYLRKSLLSPAERSFLGALDPVLPPEIRVFSKVRLEDLFGVKSGLGQGAVMAARNRINRKHVDFILVRANDLAPVAGIELDDSSHGAKARQERDLFVDELFKGAGLPLLRFPAQRSYSLTEMRTKVQALLS
ncbi:MAG: topoisomerase binding zinc finger domain protein [Verrucomicrobia bacterium]|nr:topoisomerase binding zinc finger domain protein [Verrucomicrobiota bacterium]